MFHRKSSIEFGGLVGPLGRFGIATEPLPSLASSAEALAGGLAGCCGGAFVTAGAPAAGAGTAVEFFAAAGAVFAAVAPPQASRAGGLAVFAGGGFGGAGPAPDFANDNTTSLGGFFASGDAGVADF